MDYQGVQQLMGDPSKEGAAVHGLPRTEAQPAPSPLTPLSCARKKIQAGTDEGAGGAEGGGGEGGGGEGGAVEAVADKARRGRCHGL